VQSYLNDPNLLVSDPSLFVLKSCNTKYTGGIISEEEAMTILKKNSKKLNKLQRKLYASSKHSVLIIFQAMDAAGKDSTIRTVFTGVNPAGFQVSSFKAPSKLELKHDFLWRCQKALPERGRIGIFNRSHYEEVLVCKVHPQYVLEQEIPTINNVEQLDEEFWKDRYRSITNWETHLANNGTLILKFFLNVSLEDQKIRFLSRINEPKKNWKFSIGDLKERALWPKYMEAYESAIKNTSSKLAPWYVIPADNKANLRAMVSSIITESLENLDLNYPSVNQKQKDEMNEAKEILENE
jgi:PPK2 family polyphosphate:nucleotide phosphotransferase